MTQLDNLPADQRAVLSLLLRQGKSYVQVAQMLRIDRSAVRDRAQAALAALGPRDGELDPETLSDVADYLLGQQSASGRAATRVRLEHSAAARAWARVISAELRPLAGVALPEVPAEGVENAEPFEAVPQQAVARDSARRATRWGGLALLVGLGAIVAVVVILVVNSNGGSKNSDTISGPSTTATRATTTTPTTATQVRAQAALASVQRGSRATGAAAVLTQNGQLVFAFQAQNLPPAKGFAYALWLASSTTDAVPLGFLPAQQSNGTAAAIEAVCPASGSSSTPCLPANYSHYKLLLLTQERGTRPTRPGTIVLAGSLTPR